MSGKWWKTQTALLVALLLVSQVLTACQSRADSPSKGAQDSSAAEVQPNSAQDAGDAVHEQDNALPLVEKKTTRAVIQVVAAVAVLVNMLPDTDDASAPAISTPSTDQQDCGSLDDIPLPCDWVEYLGEGEGDESLPYYPYAKRPNGCSIPGSAPGSNDILNLFYIEISFTDICNAHDRCYYTFGSTPSECNEPFVNALKKRCEEVIASHAESGWDIATFGAAKATALETCYTKVDVLGTGVIGAQDLFHAKAQITQQHYLNRVTAYVEAVQAEREPAD